MTTQTYEKSRQTGVKKTPPKLTVDQFIDIPDNEPELNGLSSIDPAIIQKTPREIDLEMFRQSILDQKRDYPAPVPVISINQRGELLPFLTLKSFSLWQGKQKSKKTTALALAVASFVKGPENSSIDHFVASMEGTVLFFDTEQGESYAARTMKLILKLANIESSSKLIYCDLREFTPGERATIIQTGVEATPDVKMVVIDGVVDLLTDFMDAAEGHMAVTEILKLSSQYDIHVAGVLHQNKNDKNARAHIGTISSQKCEMEISTEVDPSDRNQSFVVCANSRGVPFEQFAIRWDKGSLPCVNSDWTETRATAAKSAKQYDFAKELVEAIFKPFAALSHADSIKAIMNTAMKSESTAKRFLKDWQQWDMVAKGEDGNYRRNMDKGPRVQEGSNQGS